MVEESLERGITNRYLHDSFRGDLICLCKDVKEIESLMRSSL